MNFKISDDIIKILQDSIGKVFTSFEYGAGEAKFSRAYGNVRLNFTGVSLDVSNIEETVNVFGETDDISSFKCVVSKHKFVPYIEEDTVKTDVNEIVTGIEIVEDTININGGEQIIIFDQAIIVKTEKSIYMFSRDWQYSELITVSNTEDYDSVYSLNKVKSDWNNFGEYRVTVKRNKIKV